MAEEGQPKEVSKIDEWRLVGGGASWSGRAIGWKRNWILAGLKLMTPKSTTAFCVFVQCPFQSEPNISHGTIWPFFVALAHFWMASWRHEALGWWRIRRHCPWNWSEGMRHFRFALRQGKEGLASRPQWLLRRWRRFLELDDSLWKVPSWRTPGKAGCQPWLQCRSHSQGKVKHFRRHLQKWYITSHKSDYDLIGCTFSEIVHHGNR